MNWLLWCVSNLMLPVSVIEQLLPFWVNFPANTIIVALSLSFLNVLRVCCLVFFSLRKCKRQKTQHWGKSLRSYLHNGSTLEHNTNWFQKLQWRATTFVFSICRDLSCEQPSNNSMHDPDTQNHHENVLLNFWWDLSFWFSGYNVLVTIFQNVHRSCWHYFIIVSNCLYHVYPFFFIFWLYLHQLPYWEMHTDCVNNASTLSKRL